MHGGASTTDWLIAGATCVLLAGVAALLVTWSWPFSAIGFLSGEDRVDCDDDSFDRQAWVRFSTAADEAESLHQCRTLIGLSKPDVEDMLGYVPTTNPSARGWKFPAGEVNADLGPGDGQELWVVFAKDDTVARTGLAH